MHFRYLRERWWRHVKAWATERWYSACREHRLKTALKLEKALHLSQRAWNAEQSREIRALQLALDNSKKQDPLAGALKLLRLIDEVLAPAYAPIEGGPKAINAYELRCWKDDYREYLRECNRQ